MIIFLWLANLAFGLLLVMPLDAMLTNHVGNSPVFSDLFERFDYEVFMELRRELGVGFSFFQDQSLYITILYFIFSVFLLGGILVSILPNNNDDNKMGFWQGAGHYFLPLLGLSLLFLLVFGICGGLCGWICFSGGLNPFEHSTDMDLIKPLFVFIPCIILCYAALSFFHTVAKIRLVQLQTRSIKKGIVEAFHFIQANFLSSISLFFLNSVLMILVCLLGILICGCISSSLFLVAFLTSQFFIILRILFKVINLNSFEVLIRAHL